MSTQACPVGFQLAGSCHHPFLLNCCTTCVAGLEELHQVGLVHHPLSSCSSVACPLVRSRAQTCFCAERSSVTQWLIADISIIIHLHLPKASTQVMDRWGLPISPKLLCSDLSMFQKIPISPISPLVRQLIVPNLIVLKND